jgi:GR25 family glycosyltransferase involved in LPS biosynthesis
MKAVSIVIKDNAVSEFGYSKLVESSQSVGNDFDIVKWDAVIPTNVNEFMMRIGIRWNYPWEGEVVDFATGLKKSAYKTANPKARMACACSHYCLWHESATTDTTMLILEHDAYFTNKIDFDPKDIKAEILGINNPLGATRKSQLYYDMIMQSVASYQLVPWIDNAYVPQGLAGNSAYIIKPSGAKRLIELVKQYGLWPNDAIMCRQLVPRLGVTRKFYTNIQGLKSTTSL